MSYQCPCNVPKDCTCADCHEQILASKALHASWEFQRALKQIEVEGAGLIVPSQEFADQVRELVPGIEVRAVEQLFETFLPEEALAEQPVFRAKNNAHLFSGNKSRGKGKKIKQWDKR